MTASKSLPLRPSRESLRKQAKKLARDIAAGDADAIARARLHLPHAGPPITQRLAQLVIAREYGFAGWQDLIAEVSARLGDGLEWAAGQAQRAIHDNDVEGLKRLLAEYPALISWHARDAPPHTSPDGSLLGMAAGAYGDAGDPERERWFTRAACAELLIDAGAIAAPSVCEGLLESRARGLLQLFQQKGLLPRTVTYLAALDDVAGVRAALDEGGNDRAAVNDAFICACRFGHKTVASLLLECAIALDPELGRHVDASGGRHAFIDDLSAERSLTFVPATPAGPWQAFVMEQVMRAVGDGNLTAFVRGLQREPWLLGEDAVGFQVGIVERATLHDREAVIAALLDFEPALVRREPRPPSQALEIAFTYANAHLIPVLTRIWPLPDDLRYFAGMGDLSRVARWFAESVAPAPLAQHVLDEALAFAVINRHFDVADVLLAHGADINTHWNSHEPASILHHLVFLPNPYESMRFLIDRGIDMTIKDYRWNSTARGWALYALKDETMTQWLDDAERQRRLDRAPVQH